MKIKFIFFVLVTTMLMGCASEKQPQPEVIPTESISPSTNTPEPPPTETSVPTKTPLLTATIDADPAVYDNFENPANDELFNQGQWRLSGNASAPVVQQKDGKIMFSDEGDEQEYTATVLVAKNFDGFKIESPMYFEADLMLSAESGPGDVSITLYGLDISPDWFSKCFIQFYDEHGANCMHASWDEGLSGDYDSYYRKITPGDWHNFRIEIDPETLEFTYYIDNVLSGKDIPLDAEKLRGANFQVVIGISKSTVEQPVFGYIDNVKIGALAP